MYWINFFKLGIYATTLGLLAGCASQDTLLPQSERPMIDIYREAMHEAGGPAAPAFDPEVICASLSLDASIEACEETLAAHAQAVYQQIDADPAEQPLDYLEYTRTTVSELDNLFPRHANPDMVIYVYPHLATRIRAPIPGYTTVIPLFERVEYRLPGESIQEAPSTQPPGDAP